MVYSVEEIRRRIAPVADAYRLRSVYLFGSYARGEARPDSDIDLLIDLVTVSALMQKPQMPSEEDFRNTVVKGRIELYAAA